MSLLEKLAQADDDRLVHAGMVGGSHIFVQEVPLYINIYICMHAYYYNSDYNHRYMARAIF